MKITIIHLPKKVFKRGKFSGNFIEIMPLGLLPIAGLLRRDGHEAEIAHAGIEERLDPEFTVERFVESGTPDMACLPLHWHQQAFEVREALERIKKAAPGVKTLLGGLTASAFAAEIMEDWPAADYVIRGEGERPIRELAKALEAGKKDFSGIPNLLWRKRGRVVANPASYRAGPEDLAEMDFTDRSLIRNQKLYTAQYFSKPGSAAERPMHYLYVGRGCTADCAFCGGGSAAHRSISNRNSVIFREPEAVFNDIKTTIDNYGITDFYICFNPPGTDNGYYVKLFDMTRAAGLKISMVFEYYNGTPDDAFIESFAAAFAETGSRIAFSPTAFSDAARPCFYPAGMTNERLRESVRKITERGVKTLLYYALLPGETDMDVHDGLKFAMKLREKYGTSIRIFPIESEPGAPWTSEPDRFGIRLKSKTLADYVERHSRRADGFSRSDLGYDFPGFKARGDVYDMLARFSDRLYT
ncbi:MAG: cobalamin-dependent protein [bacterium]